MAEKFDKLYSEFQNRIRENKAKFEEFDNKHKSQKPYEIFNEYWFLEGSSNSFDGPENEKIKLTFKDEYKKLPEELKKLIGHV